MVFSSIVFLLYFLPAFLLLYYLSSTKNKNITAFVGSCIFYFWGVPSFFFLVFFGLIIDFYLARLMVHSPEKKRKNLLTLAISLNVGVLVIYKYLDFLIVNINQGLSLFSIGGIPLTEILLPIGISFITFQKISYLVDVYRGTTKVQEKFVNYGLYIMFFPQLIAGPIVRYNEIEKQINERQAAENIDNKLSGFFRFVIGLGKKVLIADSVGVVADQVFALPTNEVTAATAWVGILFYAFQIYFDFAGYSDMAIGMARMMGFSFPENFRFPYISQNITEFWRRWHITLGTWMRDYLYIPLGGNRVPLARVYVNLTVVFLISGIWHGASWNFVIWGAFHGIFLVADRIFLVRLLNKLGKIPSIVFTFLVVLIGWVFFRAETLGLAMDYLGNMFTFQGSELDILISKRTWLFFGIAILGSFMGGISWVEKYVEQLFTRIPNLSVIAIRAVLGSLLGLLCLVEIFTSDFNPFIYFRF
jgi:alginate O-acetyltransferase complex protein AlgI